jgi:hypothetical protein
VHLLIHSPPPNHLCSTSRFPRPSSHTSVSGLPVLSLDPDTEVWLEGLGNRLVEHRWFGGGECINHRTTCVQPVDFRGLRAIPQCLGRGSRQATCSPATEIPPTTAQDQQMHAMKRRSGVQGNARNQVSLASMRGAN